MIIIFEGTFDEISNEIQIMSNNSAYISYGVYFSNVLLLWEIQIIDYPSGD